MYTSNKLSRLRGTPSLRTMVQETTVTPADLVMPLFIVPGSSVRNEISSMPGQYQLSIDQAVQEAQRIYDLKIPAVLLFAIPESKDEIGSSAWQDDGVIQQAVAAIKEQVPGLVIITDLCFCEYTSHGHCGILSGDKLDHDATLEIIIKQTLSHAKAGADMIAPSGMIDGAVGAMRSALDENGSSEIPIMAYAAKFASAFYGPFRDAVDCAPGPLGDEGETRCGTTNFGDRKTYQMDPANADEALREVQADIDEGADIVMVKPAMAYMDIISKVKQTFGLPTAAYNVSGEYAMIKAAAEKGWIDGDKVMNETLLSLKRAGADIIITYFATEFAKRSQNK